MVTNPVKNLQESFSKIRDPRSKRARRHELLDILILAICAVICDCNTWVDIAQFCRIRKDWFSRFLSLPHGIPSHDTFGRVFAMLDPLQFEQTFIFWAEGLREAMGGEYVALDGKTLRRSFNLASGKTPLQLVSAFAGANNLVLGQMKVENESNEMKAIPDLLRILALKGCIVTIDAIGTQKETIEVIRHEGADYVLAVKRNQPNLYRKVQHCFKYGLETGFKGMEHDYYQTLEKDHGRIERRRSWTITDPDYFHYLDPKGKWQDLKSIGLVEEERLVKGKATVERRYYISSLSASARQLGEAVRSHWGIENSLHWVLDVSFGEDQCRIRKGNADENMALLRRLALNMLKRETTFRKSVRGRRLAACCSSEYLLRVLTA